MTCKTCRHLEVPLDAAGRRRVRSDYGYACLAVVPIPKNLPDSVRTIHGLFTWPPPKKFMQGSEGENCPAWEAC